MERLITQEELQSKFQSIKRSLETIYHVSLGQRNDIVEVERLIPTEPFLEEEKLHLVMDSVMNEGYSVPIVTMEHKGKFYIIDGHHRAYTLYLLGKKMIESIVLRFPEGEEYREVEEISLSDMKVKPIKKDGLGGAANDVHAMWEKAGKIALCFEKIHGVEFTVINKDVGVGSLVPTQPFVEASKLGSYVNREVPIICVEHSGKLYVLDGHNRAAVARREGMKTVGALILVPQQPVEFGIAKTAKSWGLESLNDLKVK